MEIKKPKSHEAVIHDNTEGDLILVSPAVLENKLERLERYLRAIGVVGSDIALAVAFLIPLLTSVEFQDFGPVGGATIEGAFYVGSIVMVVKIGRDLFQIVGARVKSKSDVVRSLLMSENKQSSQ